MGTKILTFCCCSENSSITVQLLTEMLKVIDGLNVFNQSDGVPPFLLLDGHGSLFLFNFPVVQSTKEMSQESVHGRIVKDQK